MEKLNNIRKHLFISVKPEFATKIVRKEKRIELRKVKPHVKIGDYVIIYASSPIKSVIGFGTIQQIIETSPQTMWEKYSSLLGIDKLRFDNYYEGKERAIGIQIEDIRQISPIPLKDLRDITPNFQPPQVYRYVSKEMCNIIIDKNFHIYVHGNRNLIEQGIDETGRKFYKIYYQEEN
jgi:predicted transcriptional regulator